MAAISGTAGGLQATSHEARLKDAFLRLLAGETVSPFPWEGWRDGPVNVSVVVNNSCNLACRHCYLQVPRLTGEPLSFGEWERFFASVLSEPGVRLAALTGKEVFLGTLGPRLLERIAGMNRALGERRKRIGVVTNGTLIGPHRDLIDACELDYLDISVDGAPRLHDEVRGAGAFALLEPNLRWAADHLGPRLFVSHTLNRVNLPHLAETVLCLSRLGVQTIACGFYHPAAYTDGGIATSGSDAAGLLDALGALGSMRWDNPMTLFVELDTHGPDALLAFLRSAWFRTEGLFADEGEVLWQEHRFTNGLRLQFKLVPFPSGVSHSVRVTPEGNYLSTDDIFDAARYRERALANIRDHGCDLGATHAAARAHPRLGEISGAFRSGLARRVASLCGAPDRPEGALA